MWSKKQKFYYHNRVTVSHWRKYLSIVEFCCPVFTFHTISKTSETPCISIIYFFKSFLVRKLFFKALQWLISFITSANSKNLVAVVLPLVFFGLHSRQNFSVHKWFSLYYCRRGVILTTTKSYWPSQLELLTSTELLLLTSTKLMLLTSTKLVLLTSARVDAINAPLAGVMWLHFWVLPSHHVMSLVIVG